MRKASSFILLCLVKSKRNSVEREAKKLREAYIIVGGKKKHTDTPHTQINQ